VRNMPVDRNDSTRLVTYSHDGFGLGHLRRTLDIARWVVRDVPESNVLMLIGCPSASLFALPPGIDYIKIPSIIKVDTEIWHMRNLRIDQKKGKALRASIIQKATEVLDPQFFLVDHIPAGVWGELVPTLEVLRRRGVTKVLGLRDILDAPEVTRAAWERKHFYQLINTYYDQVFIYGCRDIFDTASNYGMDREVPEEKISYCGYVCSDGPHATPQQVRRELRVQNQPLVLITAGGGYDAYPMMRACLDAFQLLGKPLPFVPLFITGPLMQRDQQESLWTHAAGLNIRVLTSVEDTLGYMNAADLVVTMAGYNSLCEVLHLKKKALVVPRAGPSAEQVMRARLFAGRGLIDVLYPQELSAKNLAERIVSDLERTDFPRHDPAIELCGGRRAARRLLELGEEKVIPTPALRQRSSERVPGFIGQGL